MHDNPLAMPQNGQLLAGFQKHFGLSPGKAPGEALVEVARAFSRLPYENLTKIIKEAQLEHPGRSRRFPDEVIGDHLARGTGGTCFSLTAALLHLVRSLGFEAQPVLADRRYGQNTHCALLVWIDDRPHLLDPGYLIVEPIPLDLDRQQNIKTSFNQLILDPLEGGDKLELHTLAQGQKNHRLTFKTQPVDAGEFIRWWDRSFDWDMMRYPVLTRVTGAEQLYLQGSRFQVRSHQAIQRDRISPERLVEHIAARFGIDPAIAARALAVLKDRGESND